MKLLILLLAVLFVSFSMQNGEVKLTADADAIKCGEVTTLKWKVLGAERLFLFGVGKVAAEGDARVKPLKTTTYSLLVEGPDGRRSKSITITVDGCQKGDDDYPQDEKYEFQRNGNRPAPSLVAFLARTHQVLQDRLGLTVMSYQSSEGIYIFKTKMLERRASTADDEKNRIGARRVSYLIQINLNQQTGGLAYTIKTFTMKKKVLKETWTVENDSAIGRAEADKVAELLNQI